MGDPRHQLILVCLTLLTALPASAELIQIRAFEATTVGDLRIGFDDLLFDQRCPSDATCFWEGDAAIKIVVRLGGSEPQEFELHTYYNFGVTAEIGSYTITMVALLPVPLLDIKPVPEDYVVTLWVDEAVPTREASWSSVKSRF